MPISYDFISGGVRVFLNSPDDRLAGDELLKFVLRPLFYSCRNEILGMHNPSISKSGVFGTGSILDLYN